MPKTLADQRRKDYEEKLASLGQHSPASESSHGSTSGESTKLSDGWVLVSRKTPHA